MAARIKDTAVEAQARQVDAQEEKLAYIASILNGSKKSGTSYKALCPAHKDKNPSLSMGLGRNGGIVMRCHVGCTNHDILAVLGLRAADLMPGAKIIAATYEYRDEESNLLYETVRCVPKGFRQRAPKEGGGYTWSLQDVRRVLYRLPELLTADPSQPVFLVEGEKDADRLAEMGLTVTTSVGGAKGPWLDEYTEALWGRHVVLLADNDEVGWERVHARARDLAGVAASVRIPELSNLPEKGDVSNWLDDGGTKESLLALVEATHYGTTDGLEPSTAAGGTRGPVVSQHDASADPPSRSPVGRSVVGTTAESHPVEPFPVEVFPQKLQRFINSVATALPCPPDFPAVMMLPVLGAAVGRKRRIRVKSGWTEYPLLWSAVVAQSGDKKTPAFRHVVAPVEAKLKEMKTHHAAELAAYKQLSREEQAQEPAPVLKQTFTTDATMEALKRVLEANPDGVLYAVDELSGWVRGMGQYKGGRGDDRQQWLSIWSSSSVVCNRVSREPIVLDSPFVAVTGGIQPACLGDLVDDSSDDGCPGRILFSYPDRVADRRWREDTVQGADDYAAAWDHLWNLTPDDEPVTLTAAAKGAWVEWYNEFVQETPPPALQSAWFKMDGNCARLALLLFLSRRACRETKVTEVDAESVRGAIKLVRYFQSHARRVYSSAAEHSDTGRIGKALQWIRKRGGRVTAVEVQQYGVISRGPHANKEAKELLKDLADLGYGTIEKEKRNSIVFKLHDDSRQTVSAGE